MRTIVTLACMLSVRASFTTPGVCYRRSHRSAACSAAVPPSVSLAAGMVGGAIGVGVAYPLDTLKTKTQSRVTRASSNPLALAAEIIRTEGVAGFYSGVSSTMTGQAIIKGIVFLVYEAAKAALSAFAAGDDPGFRILIIAACISGAVGSLVVTPVERIKCVMQAGEASAYDSPLACIAVVVRRDGWYGLAFRGLGATLLREVPAYAFYFVSYDLVKDALLGSEAVAAPLVPLIGGAVAGAMAWIPVYPIDVIKTQIQVELDDGDESECSVLATTRRLWQSGGFAAFWDGLGPKLARAVVNHAVTFYVFEQICGLYRTWT